MFPATTNHITSNNYHIICNIIPCDLLMYYLVHQSSTSKRSLTYTIFFVRLTGLILKNIELSVRKVFFLRPLWGLEVDFKPSCLDSSFPSLFAAPTNVFYSELYCLTLVYRRVRPWILCLAMNISPRLCSLTINYKFLSYTTDLLY